MIEISLLILLIIYGIAVAVFILFAVINLFHILAYGFLSFESFFITFIFLALTVLILFITYKLGLAIDWAQTFIL